MVVLCSTKFQMDEWKRTYSNSKDRAKDAMPWFWEHFDADCYSIWFCEYQYTSELKRLFMTNNLVNGVLLLAARSIAPCSFVLALFAVLALACTIYTRESHSRSGGHSR